MSVKGQLWEDYVWPGNKQGARLMSMLSGKFFEDHKPIMDIVYTIAHGLNLPQNICQPLLYLETYPLPQLASGSTTCERRNIPHCGTEQQDRQHEGIRHTYLC